MIAAPSRRSARRGFTVLFSVVINTYNRAGMLAATLEALRRQDGPEFEVVVVNGPSDDGTAELLAARAGRLRVVDCPERHLARSRNLGIDAAAGDVVAFVDDDAIPEPAWLAELAAAYEDPAVAGAGGVVLDRNGVLPQYRFSACDRLGGTNFDVTPPFGALLEPGADPFLYLQGTNMSFRRSALAEVGGFDEEIEYNYDEADVCLRLIDAGHRPAALDGARVHHKVAASHLRGAAADTVDPFVEIKNRTYFAVRHGRATHSLEAILAALAPHLAHVRAGARDRRADGRLSAAQLDRFLARLDEGFELGVRRGLADPPPPRAIAARDPGAFVPYPVHRPEGGRLRVCLASRELPPEHPGGVARLTRDLAAGLAEEGHDVHVVTRAAGADRVDLEDGVWVHRIPTGRRFAPELDGHPLAGQLEHLAAVYRAVSRIHAATPLDVVAGPLWTAEALACAYDPRWADVLVCMTPMRLVAASQPAVAERAETPGQIALEDAALGAASHLHVLSQANLDALATERPADVLAPGAPDRRSEAPRTRPADDGTVEVLFAGRLEPRKGADVLLDAAAGLLRERPQVRLRLLGADTGAAVEGRERYADRLRRTAPDVADRVTFEGEVSDERLWAAYADCDVFCAPSRYESFGLVLIEAMSFGRPVVASRAGGMAEIVRDGETGLLVEPGDADALRDALRTLADGPALRERLGTAARARFEAEFALPVAARRTAAAYRRYAAERAAGAGDAPEAAAHAAAPPGTSPEAAVEAGMAGLLRDVAGLDAPVAARAAVRLLAPSAFPVDLEPALRRAGALADDAAFAGATYEALLGRSPDPDWLHEQLTRLAHGTTRLEVVRTVAGSDEGRARGIDPGLPDRVRGIDPVVTVAAVRRTFTLPDAAFVAELPGALGVTGDHEPLRGALTAALPQGRRAALDAALAREEVAPLLTDASRRALAEATLLTRDELDDALRELAGADDTAFVDGVYRLLLGRPADSQGLAGHASGLAGGRPRVELVRTIAASEEAARHGVETSWLDGLEGRVPALRGGRGRAAARRVLQRRPRTGATEPVDRLAGHRGALEAVATRLERLVSAGTTAMEARIAALEAELRSARDAAERAQERRNAELLAAVQEARAAQLHEPQVFGPADRLSIDETAVVNDALFNTISGSVTVARHAFFGHGVAVLTGTHDVDARGAERQRAVPDQGRDVVIGEGAWVASRATVIGPCQIGRHAVVAAGAIVTGDVPEGAVVAGVPARVVRVLDATG